ncbi:MAG: heteromeric transposase endonuclease subunit TnsA [Deltaproteobacteria bacterium]|nr:heteromeric transposase endonuclease subunit TnsA [Deltaproteobacteria bacterium]
MRGPKWNENTISRFQREGRGKGAGHDYKPWIRVEDFSSLGESRRVFGLKTQREHHLFSNVEWDLFLLLEWNQYIVDIREQFPLERSLTQELAASLGIRHPCYPGTKTPAVLTADFVVIRRHQGKNILEAYNAKRTEEAEEPTSLEKLEIQRSYFQSAGTPHHLIFHSELPRTEIRNIEWIRGGYVRPGEEEPYPGFYVEHQDTMAAFLAKSGFEGSLADFCSYYERQYGLSPGTGLKLAKQLIFNRVLSADLSCDNLARAPMPSFRLLGQKGKLRLMGAN